MLADVQRNDVPRLSMVEVAGAVTRSHPFETLRGIDTDVPQKPRLVEPSTCETFDWLGMCGATLLTENTTALPQTMPSGDWRRSP